MKKGLLYILVTVVLLWSGASFAAQSITQYSGFLSLKDNIMTAVAKEEHDNLLTLSNLPGSQSLQGGISQDTTIKYELGAQNEEILLLKYKLYYLGYIAQQPKNNTFDEATQQAMMKYQAAKGMAQTATIDQKLLDILAAEKPTYEFGKTGEEIKKYQLILYYTDFLAVYPSGYYGNITTESVSKYQAAKNLPQNGTLDPATQAALEKEDYAYKIGKTGDEIAAMQRILISHGYLTGSASGTYDQNTKTAVEKFQTEKGLPVTGEIDKATRSLLSAL